MGIFLIKNLIYTWACNNWDITVEIVHCPSMLYNVSQHQWTNNKEHPYEHMYKYNNHMVTNVINKNWFLKKGRYSYKNTFWKIFWLMTIFGCNFVKKIKKKHQVKNKEKYQEDHFLWDSNMIFN